MSQSEDNRLVDYLYDEMSEEEAQAFEQALSEDAALSEELASMEEALGVLRSVEDEEPSAHLDSLILATARQTAEAAEDASWWAKLRKSFSKPLVGVVAAASMAAVAGIALFPQMSADEAMRADEIVPLGSARAPVAAKLEAEEEPAELQRITEDAEGAAQAAAAADPAPDDDAMLDQTVRRASKPEPKRAPKRRTRARKKRRMAKRPPMNIEADKKGDVARGPAPGAGSVGDLGGTSGGAAFGSELSKDALAAKPATKTAAPAKTPAPSAPIAAVPPPEPEAEPAPPPPAPRPAVKAEVARRESADRKEAERRLEDGSRGFAGGKRTRSTGRAAPAEAPASAEATDEVTDRRQRAATLARDMIRAAEQELKRNQVDSARRILSQAVQRTRGTPSQGDVLLRWAYLERNAKRYAQCVSLAERASRVPGFARRAEARRLVNQIAPLIERESAPAPASQPPPR